MLYVLFQAVVSEEEAAKLTDRKMVQYPDHEFTYRTGTKDLNEDIFFKKCVEAVDECDIPFRNVVRDLLTGETHSFDKVSTGVHSLWLAHYYNKDYIIPTCYFGPNCYKLLVESSKDRDIYVYDDSGMMVNYEADACEGEFTDFHTKEVIQFGEDRAFDYVIEKGY